MSISLAIYPVRPFHGEGRRMLVKRPKVYGFDTGFVACLRGLKINAISCQDCSEILILWTSYKLIFFFVIKIYRLKSVFTAVSILPTSFPCSAEPSAIPCKGELIISLAHFLIHSSCGSRYLSPSTSRTPRIFYEYSLIISLAGPINPPTFALFVDRPCCRESLQVTLNGQLNSSEYFLWFSFDREKGLWLLSGAFELVFALPG